MDDKKACLPKLDISILNKAVSAGNLKLAKHIVERGILPSEETLKISAKGNKYLFYYILKASKGGVIKFKQVTKQISSRFTLKPIQALHLTFPLFQSSFSEETHAFNDDDVFHAALHLGDLELVKLILSQSKPTVNEFALNIAVSGGHLDVANFLMSSFDISPTQETLKVAIFSRNFQLVEMALSKGIRPDLENISDGVNSLNLTIVQLSFVAKQFPELGRLTILSLTITDQQLYL